MLIFEDNGTQVSISIQYDDEDDETFYPSHEMATLLFATIANLPDSNLHGTAEGMEVMNDIITEIINAKRKI